MEFQFGPARARYQGLEERMAPYLAHPLRRVREWALFELGYAKQDISTDEQWDAERARR
jgi:hypothetical protein